jgi:hypothetical protein
MLGKSAFDALEPPYPNDQGISVEAARTCMLFSIQYRPCAGAGT